MFTSTPWVPEPVRMDVEKGKFHSFIEIETINLPACSKSLYCLHYPSSAKIVPRSSLLICKLTLFTWNKHALYNRLWNFTIYTVQNRIKTLLLVIRIRYISSVIHSFVTNSEVSKLLNALKFFFRSAVWMTILDLFHIDMADGQILGRITRLMWPNCTVLLLYQYIQPSILLSSG